MRFKAPSDGKKAFTLVEIIVALALLLVMAAAATPFAGSFFASVQLDEESDRFIATVRTARERAVAGYHDARHGIYVDATPDSRARYTLYEGSSWATRVSANDSVIVLDDPFSFSGVFDINFSRMTGRASPVAVDLIHATEGRRTVSITSFGLE